MIFLRYAVCLLTVLESTACFAQDPAHSTVRRSLPFLEKHGVAWIKDRGCVTCHHTPFLLWTHTEAHRRGFTVDRQKLEAWTNWTLLNVLANLDAEPDGEADTLSQLLLARDGTSPWFTKPAQWHSRPADPYENLTKHLLKAQAAEGSWIAGGQSSNPKELSTGWALLALASRDTFMKDRFPLAEKSSTFHTQVQANNKALPVARDKGLAWLKQQDPVKTTHLTEGLITRLLVARQFGSPQAVDELRQQLLSRQNTDGGWSTDVSRQQPSDAFATGMSLYALKIAGVSHDKEKAALARGIAFLVKTQQPDGGWRVPSTAFYPSKGKPEHEKATDAVYSYWGTGWATLGLLHSIPLNQSADK